VSRLILIRYVKPAKVFLDRELLVVSLAVVVVIYLEEMRLSDEWKESAWILLSF